MTGAKRYVLIFGLLLGVLVMHGGIGMGGCSSMAAMGGGLPASVTTSVDHAPAVPVGPSQTTHSDTCASPLPPSSAGLLVVSLMLLGFALPTTFLRRERRPVIRWSGRAPPRSRLLDPQTGLGVFRT